MKKTTPKKKPVTHKQFRMWLVSNLQTLERRAKMRVTNGDYRFSAYTLKGQLSVITQIAEEKVKNLFQVCGPTWKQTEATSVSATKICKPMDFKF